MDPHLFRACTCTEYGSGGGWVVRTHTHTHDASGHLVPLSTTCRAELKRLRKNAAIADALRRLALAAPDVDGSARRGQYVLHMHGGLDSPLWGRHYACGTYIDSGGKRRSPDLQGCPREVRLLLAAPSATI